jgi:hypothetical protein
LIQTRHRFAARRNFTDIDLFWNTVRSGEARVQSWCAVPFDVHDTN